MKKVLGSHAQTAHVWAQNNQLEGRASDKRMFFEHGTIYSYGTHFAIASHVKDLKGNACILFTNSRYSVSTGKHISYTQRALSGLNLTTYYVKYAEQGRDKDNLDSFDKDLETLYLNHAKPRIRQSTRDSIANDIRNLIEQRNALGKAFIKKYKSLAIPTDIAASADARMKAQAKKLKAEAKATAQALESILNEIEKLTNKPRDTWAQAWRLNDFDAFNVNLSSGQRYFVNDYVSNTHGTLLRVKDAGKTVETSRHAEFPVKHAKPAFKFIKSMRDTKTPWTKNGKTIHLGHFQIDSIDKEGNVRAGCHFVKYAEIELLAKTLGLV